MHRGFLARRAVSLGIAVSLIGGSVVMMAEPAAAAPAWTVQTSPTPSGTPLSSFSNVACAGTTLCYAVGTFTFDNNRTQAMVKRWNGTAWSLVTVPSPVGATSTSLTGVRCQSATNCFAVGNYKTQTVTKTMILHWVNAVGWSVMASPNPISVDVNLTSISCPSATTCFAVGQFDNGSASKALIEKWNGTSWAIMTTPTGVGATDTHLSSVACPSLTSCLAVGDFLTTTAQKTLVLRYNGTAWAVSTSPNPAGTFAGLSSIACPVAGTCFAVGSYSTSTADKTLVEKWNGSTWAIVTSPNASGTSSVLRSVACASATSCMAAGESITTAEHTLTIRLTGATWALVTSPNPAGSTGNQLSGIACAGGAFCLAVGGSGTTSGLNPLVIKWNGTAWAVSATPGLASTGYGILNAVTCLSETSCLAVGQFNTGFFTRTTSAKWDGVSWVTVTPPNPAGASTSKLLGVSCVNATLCIAVGSTTVSGIEKTLVEKWNGTAWSILTSPNVTGAEANTLSAVACVSTTSCFAVGNYVKAGVTKTLAQRWNGTTWNTQVSPNPVGGDPVILESISCPSTTSCFAVGRFDTASDQRTLIERWNGTAWAIMASPNVAGAGLIDLNAVSCPSTTSCFAVGYSTTGFTTSTLVEQWSGTTWAVVSSPNPAGATDAELNGISCPTLTDCFAVGRYDTANGLVTLVEQWDGATWTEVASPNPVGTTGSELNAVHCQTAVDCFAVGDNRVIGNRRSLIEHWAEP